MTLGKGSVPRIKINLEPVKAYRRGIFSQERMEYYSQKLLVTYESKYGKKAAEFDPLEWIAAPVSHIPDRREQMLRYMGHYSNTAMGELKKEDSQLKYHIIEDDSYTELNR